MDTRDQNDSAPLKYKSFKTYLRGIGLGLRKALRHGLMGLSGFWIQDPGSEIDL